ncbi:MAG: GNAT family N-acetyltransferase [Oscillospiraceae bacterium]|nr:GNAT family N-acetyltransferase [Oscillospiraceae bacterium]
MKHCGTKTIETGRLVLRQFSVDDAHAMYQNWASDPDVTRYLTWSTYTNVEDSRAVLADWVAAYEKANYYMWAIVLKSHGSDPIGSISAVKLDDAIDAVEIGYCIGKAWWRQGVTSEALSAVMDFFFDEVGANRVAARHDTNNPHSGMVMRKCGMKYEGTLRSADRNNQGICDISCYALLRSER